MNQPMSDNDWSQLKAIVKQDLAGVTERDLAACDSRDELAKKLQEIYKISPKEAEGAVKYYEQRLALWYDKRPIHAVN